MKFLYPLLTLLIVPLVALAWVVKKMVIPFKKSSQNGMIRLEEDGEKVLFSPYFEFESFLAETKLLVKIVIQLGNIGIKKDLIAPIATMAAGYKPQRLLFRETTLFLINQGETPIEVTPKYLEIENDTISKLIGEPQLIASGHYYECEPNMAKDRREVLSYKINAVLEYEGAMHEVRGIAKRLSVQALEIKYPKAPDA